VRECAPPCVRQRNVRVHFAFGPPRAPGSTVPISRRRPGLRDVEPGSWRGSDAWKAF
jgi:hypothetical protein